MSDSVQSDTWFYRERGEIKGPFTQSQMQSLVRRRRVGRHMEVSQDSYQWVRAAEFPELFETSLTKKVRKSSDSILLAPKESAPDDSARSGGDAEEEVFEVVPSPVKAETGNLPQEWHYIIGDREPVGPIAAEELIDLIQTGKVRPDDLVWHSGMTDWQRLSFITVLARWVPAASPAEQAGRSEVANLQAIPATGGKSALAVTSMVLGILSVTLLWGLAAIPAIVLGHLGLSEVNRTQVDGRGLAVTGLVLGYTSLGLTILGLVILAQGQ